MIPLTNLFRREPKPPKTPPSYEFTYYFADGSSDSAVATTAGDARGYDAPRKRLDKIVRRRLKRCANEVLFPAEAAK